MSFQRSSGKCHGNHNDSILPRGMQGWEGGRHWHAHTLVDSAKAELSGVGGYFWRVVFKKGMADRSIKVLKVGSVCDRLS